MSKNSQCSSEDQGPASVTTLLIFQVVNARRQRANVGSLWPVLKTTGSCRAESNLQCAPICQRLLSVADLLVKTSSSSEKPRWLCLPVKLRTGGGRRGKNVGVLRLWLIEVWGLYPNYWGAQGLLIWLPLSPPHP